MATRPVRTTRTAIRTPTVEEYAAYDGAHCHKLWRGLPPDWRCPGCNRTRFEILCWTTRYRASLDGGREKYEGWLAGLDQHHDHSQEHRYSTAGRFVQVTMCKHCNAADGTAKRELALPDRFSFAPWEIARFVTATPHGAHVICYETARAIYEALPRRVSFF